MELKNLETFISAAEMESFSKAAKQLGYVQSTVTMQIKQLEDELGVALFNRNGKRVTLSSSGRQLLPYARALLKMEKEIQYQMKEEEKPHGELRVGIMESICNTLFQPIWVAYLQKYTEVNVVIHIATPLELGDMLDKGEIDIMMILDEPFLNERWELAAQKEEEVSFFAACNHPLANEKLQLEQILQQPILLSEKGRNYNKALDNAANNMRLPYVVKMNVGSTDLLIHCVKNNVGISLLPMYALKEELEKSEIALLHISDFKLTMWMQLFYHKNRWLSPAAKQFIALVKNTLLV